MLKDFIKYSGEYINNKNEVSLFGLYTPFWVMALFFISHKGLILSHLLYLIRNKVTLRTFSMTAM